MSKTPKLRFKEFSGDWEIKKLGDLANIGTGKKDTQDKVEDGIYPFFVRSQNIERINSYSFDGEAILTAGDGVGVGKVFHYINGKFDYHQRVYKLSDFTKGTNGRYIYEYFRKHFIREVTKYTAKTSVDSVRMEMITKMDIPYPSIEEQEKIASFFSLIDDKISLQGEKLKMLKDYKKGMMQKIFSRELRFKDDEGRDYPEWNHKKLSSIVERVTRKNKGTQSTLPLTISAQYGLVDQITFFNKTVASSNLEGYYLLEKGEFAYNKSYSTGYPFGAIKRLDRYDKGVLSSLYICFSILKNIDSDFLVQYFETSCWHKEISMIAVEGARNHGLLNISVSDFFETYHWIPCYEEQVKIGKFLNKIDKKINKEQEKLDSLNEHKKGLLQQMFV